MADNRRWRTDPGHPLKKGEADVLLHNGQGPFGGRPVSSLHIGTGGMAKRSREMDRHTFGITSAMVALGHPTGLLIAAEVPGGDVPPEVEVRRFLACDEPLVTRWIDVKHTYQKAAHSQRPDIVVSHFALYAVAVLEEMKGLPHVAHYYGPHDSLPTSGGESTWAQFHERRQERAVYQNANLIITYSAASRDRLIRDFEVDGDRVRLLQLAMGPGDTISLGAHDEQKCWQDVATQALEVYQEAIDQK